jgi:hypothetical protein
MKTVPLGGLFEYTRRPIFVSASVQSDGRKQFGRSGLSDHRLRSTRIRKLRKWETFIFLTL